MTSRDTVINIGGQKVRVRHLDFEIRKEEWNEYSLLDGGTVRFKSTVMQIFQALDDQGQPILNDDGQPRIIVQSKQDTVTRL